LSTTIAAAAGSGGEEDGASVERAGGIVFALLVLACFVAFFVTQRLKHTPTAVQSFKLTPVFSPTPTGHIKLERISFKLASADEVTVTVINSDGNTVATLVRDRAVPRYKQFSLRWNGREGTARAYTVAPSVDGLSKILTPIILGRLAPAGEYRVRVRLREQNREVLSPRSFTLVRP
jgi:hypothetical protein